MLRTGLVLKPGVAPWSTSKIHVHTEKKKGHFDYIIFL